MYIYCVNPREDFARDVDRKIFSFKDRFCLCVSFRQTLEIENLINKSGYIDDKTSDGK